MARKSAGRILLAAALCGSCMVACMVNPNAGGTSTGNGVVLGALYGPGGGEPARDASIFIRSHEYLANPPAFQKRKAVMTGSIDSTHTDRAGNYRFDSIPEGVYCIEGRDNKGNFVLRDSVVVDDEGAGVRFSDTLAPPATVEGTLPWGYDFGRTGIFIWGLDRYAMVGPEGTFSLLNVPRGMIRLRIAAVSGGENVYDTVVFFAAAGDTCIVDTLISLPTINTFRKDYGGSGTEAGYSVQQTSDGGYIIVGYTNSFGAGGEDVYLLKTDSLGKKTWAKTFGGTGDDRGYSVEQTRDGGYIVAGNTHSFGEGSSDIYLVKTDAAGTALWTKTYKDTGNDYCYSVMQADDDGYVVARNTRFYGEESNVYVIKTGGAGDTVWTRRVEGGWFCNSLQPTLGGGYCIAGGPSGTGMYIAGIYVVHDGFLVNFDPRGDTTWTPLFGKVNFEQVASVKQTRGGGSVIIGYNVSSGERINDVSMMKTDAAGKTVWTKPIGSTNKDAYYSVQQTRDGGNIITCVTRSPDEKYNVHLTKTDADGNTAWNRIFGGEVYTFGNPLRQTKDGGYVITGYTNSFGAGNGDVILIKTDGNGAVE